jgi:hypothetical protein
MLHACEPRTRTNLQSSTANVGMLVMLLCSAVLCLPFFTAVSPPAPVACHGCAPGWLISAQGYLDAASVQGAQQRVRPVYTYARAGTSEVEQ